MTEKKTKKLIIRKEYCKACGMCIKVCPFGVLAFSKEFNKEGDHFVEQVGECRGCGRCYLMCPDTVIEVLND